MTNKTTEYEVNEINRTFTVGEGYELPSGGLIYEEKINPHVELRSMTARDEMKRLNPSTTPLKTLADIIEGCFIDKPQMHVYDMSLGDYEFLLHKLRIVTYGPKYKMSVGCPFCLTQHDVEANLEELEIRDFDIEKFNSLKTFELPKSGRTVSIHFQTPHTLDAIENKTKELKRKFKDANIDFNIQATLQLLIDTVDGLKLNQTDLVTFINNLPALDMTKILNNIDLLSQCLGVDSRFHMTCPSCGGDITAFFRFGPEFFRPTNI